MEKRKLIYDCDPGTDDSVSIIMAIMEPSVDLLAITCESGNFKASVSANHALKVLEYIEHPEIPVYKGTEHPLVREYPRDPYCHGQDGLGNHFFPEPKIETEKMHAANAIVELVNKYPGEITIVCTAPLTNLALAMLLDPSIKDKIKQVIHLGGAYGFSPYAFTNATGDNPMSEWNVYVDPEAAKIVYESGINLVTIGLDVAFNPDMVNIGEKYLDELKKIGNKAAKYALEIIDYIDGNNTIKEKGLFINGPIDTTAMCSFIEPTLLKTEKVHVVVDTGSQLTRGMTITDRRDHFMWTHIPEIETAVSIDSERYQETFVRALKGEGK